MAVVTMKNLLESGVHFGHQVKRWDPRMKKYIFAERNGIHIIDLQKTIAAIKDGYDAVRKVTAAGKSVLFVGTKKQAQQAVQKEAERCGMFYVNNRWLGGMLTNFSTIKKSLNRLKKIEKMIEEIRTEAFYGCTSLESITIPKSEYETKKQLSSTRLLDMNKSAAKFFHKCLMAPEGKPALDYLLKRKFSPAYSPQALPQSATILVQFRISPATPKNINASTVLWTTTPSQFVRCPRSFAAEPMKRSRSIWLADLIPKRTLSTFSRTFTSTQSLLGYSTALQCSVSSPV